MVASAVLNHIACCAAPSSAAADAFRGTVVSVGISAVADMPVVVAVVLAVDADAEPVGTFPEWIDGAEEDADSAR